MKIAPFGVEIWMNDYETRCQYNLAETCVESLTVDELLEISGATDTLLDQIRPIKLTYGPIEGSLRLRTTPARITTSIVDMYDKGISTASMSKAFSMAGLRLGWIAGPDEVIDAVAIHRDYNTISVGRIDDLLACLALENKDAILQRSQEITRSHRVIVDEWLAGEPRVSWVRPTSGTTALLRYDLDLPSRDFCIGLLEETGVLLTPGSAMDMEGYLRLGYAGNRDELVTGLPLITKFLDGR